MAFVHHHVCKKKRVNKFDLTLLRMRNAFGNGFNSIVWYDIAFIRMEKGGGLWAKNLE